MNNHFTGNIMTRLGGLKNVSKRRVMPGEEFLENLEDTDTDVSGTSAPLPDFANFQDPTANVPETDFGEELTPQSYDVRANVVEKPDEEPGFYTRLGQALSDYFNPQKIQEMSEKNAALFNRNQSIPDQEIIQAESIPPQSPPIQTEQVDISEGLPPVTPSQEMALESPEMNAALPPVAEAENKEPGTYVKLGASNDIYNDPNTPPELKAEIERIFDTRLTPERTKEVNEFEKVVDAFMNKLEGVETALTAREKTLLDKVENRNLSASEQISMALALIAPALIGGLIGGKQGLAGGLAAGGQNISNVLAGREKEFKEAQKLLPEIALERSKVAQQKLKTTQEANELKRKIKEIVPNHKLKELFSKDGMILNGKLVLDTGNPLLPLKSTAIRSMDDYKNFKEKKMPELSEKVSTTEQGLSLMDDLQDLIDYSEKARSGLQHEIPLYPTLSNLFKAFVPASRDTFIDEDGNEVKISELYETLTEQLSDMYSQAIGTAGAKTAFKTYREHFRKMLPNPFTIEAIAKGHTQLGTIRGQIKSVKDKFENAVIKKLDSAGIETEPMKKLFSSTKINKNRSETTRKNNRANEAVKEVLGQ